jgi:hypothetical protein
MNVKKFALAAVAIHLGVTSGSAIAGPQEREKICLSIGQYAETVAKGRDDGRPEKDAITHPSSVKKGTPEGDFHIAAEQVVAWLYTVHESPSESRKLVYLKCLNKEFFAYNPKVDR